MKIDGYEVHPAADLFPMLDELGFQRLVEDIRANGLKVPIVLLDGKILDGRNRLLACKKAGVAPAFVKHDDRRNPWRAVWSLNAERRHIEDKIRLALIGKRMLSGSDAWEALQARAQAATKKALAEAGKKGGRGKKKASPSREGEAFPVARDRSNAFASRIAAAVGDVSRATVERALALEEKRPEAAEAVVRGEKEGATVLREVKREERHAEIAKQAETATPIGEVKACPIVYADPPWQYGNTAGASAAEDEYPTMPLADICALHAPATKDAVLFLWATSPLLPEAFEVIRAWGFTYKASMVWDKGSGTGNWVLNAHEILLIAVRGDIPCPAPANRPVSVIRAPVGRHSAKPEAFAEAIERMFPGLPKVEMFARRTREGWTAWGNQAA